MGRQVLVFNCDEAIDFQAMGRIFVGLQAGLGGTRPVTGYWQRSPSHGDTGPAVKSGAWGCFDEFNRLKEDQLSAVSQQIQIRGAGGQRAVL